MIYNECTGQLFHQDVDHNQFHSDINAHRGILSLQDFALDEHMHKPKDPH